MKEPKKKLIIICNKTLNTGWKLCWQKTTNFLSESGKWTHIQVESKIGYFALTVFASRTWLSPVSVWKYYSSFSKLPVQKTVKDSIFLEWVSESIRIVIWSNSQFKFCTRNFAKSEFVVSIEKLIWQTQEVMTELRIVLDSRTKTFLH